MIERVVKAAATGQFTFPRVCQPPVDRHIYLHAIRGIRPLIRQIKVCSVRQFRIPGVNLYVAAVESAVVNGRFAGEHIDPDVQRSNREGIIGIGEFIIGGIPGVEIDLGYECIRTHIHASVRKLRTACHQDLITADQREHALQLVRHLKI